MMTVKEVSRLSGVSIRSLHHYDRIGLLPATEFTAAGYRLYDNRALERLQMILLFKELQIPLKEIKAILDNPGFDQSKVLEQQIQLLKLRKEHLENLIDLACEIKILGVEKMSSKNFEVFDTHKIDEYAAQAKASWGATDAYREFEKNSERRSREEEKLLGVRMMEIFSEFGTVRNRSPKADEAQNLVEKLKTYITKHYYTCTDEILESLGRMYAEGGAMTANIDKYAGNGTAIFVNETIKAYVSAKSGDLCRMNKTD